MMVYVSIAGLFGMMGIIVWYAGLDHSELEEVEIKLQNVDLICKFIKYSLNENITNTIPHSCFIYFIFNI